jgi:RecJ-like exonuclease
MNCSNAKAGTWDQLIESDEPESICSRCNGSGEGMYDGTTCPACGGSGIERDDIGSDDYYEEDSDDDISF